MKIQQTVKEKTVFRPGELLYYIFFAVMLFSKGMGWYDGMAEYKLCLMIGVVCLLAKLALDEYTLWECLVIGVFGLLGVVSWRLSHEKGMFTCMMIVIGMKNVPAKRVFKVGAVIWGGVFAYRLFAFLTGAEKGIILVHDKLGLGHIFRWSMGYPHPNVFHISYVILLAFLFYLTKPKGRQLIVAVLAAFAGNCFIFLYSVSFTGFLLTMIYLVMVVYFEQRKHFSRLEELGILCVLPFCLICSLLLPLMPDGELFRMVNKLMNTRLGLSRYFLQNQRISLFGQQMIVPDPDLNIDNSFLFALMNYGAVIFILLMTAYFFMIRYMVKNEKRKELAITLGFLIAGISEPFLFNTSFKNMTLVFVGSFLFSDVSLPDWKLSRIKVGVTTFGSREITVSLPCGDGTAKGRKGRGFSLPGRIAAVVCALSAALIGGGLYGSRLEMPKGYLFPVNICDYSEQEERFLTYEEVKLLQQEKIEVPYYVDKETPMYYFDGNIVKVEFVRSVAGHALLYGLAGGLAGAVIALILDRRKERQDSALAG